jgi:hypothetical protein
MSNQTKLQDVCQNHASKEMDINGQRYISPPQTYKCKENLKRESDHRESQFISLRDEKSVNVSLHKNI